MLGGECLGGKSRFLLVSWLLRPNSCCLFVDVDRRSTENLLITAKHRRNSFGNRCLLSYAVKVINK